MPDFSMPALFSLFYFQNNAEILFAGIVFIMFLQIQCSAFSRRHCFHYFTSKTMPGFFWPALFLLCFFKNNAQLSLAGIVFIILLPKQCRDLST